MPAAAAGDDQLVVSSIGGQKTTVIYPAFFTLVDNASAFLSSDLVTPVFSLEVYKTFWSYHFFVNGEELDRFTTDPGFLGIETDEVRVDWRGNPEIIRSNWPGIMANTIENYLRFWSENEDGTRKAYSNDRAGFGEVWQIVDFMGKLGLRYPVADNGEVHGTTYKFVARKGRPIGHRTD